MNIKLRYVILAMFLPIVLPIIIGAFWPKMIIVHYDNPNEPIEISLIQYDDTETIKILESGTRIFKLKQGLSMRSRDVAYLYWHRTKDHKTFTIHDNPNFPEVSDTLNLGVCRGNIYLNKDGSVQKAEWTYPVFMNLCL